MHVMNTFIMHVMNTFIMHVMNTFIMHVMNIFIMHCRYKCSLWVLNDSKESVSDLGHRQHTEQWTDAAGSMPSSLSPAVNPFLLSGNAWTRGEDTSAQRHKKRRTCFPRMSRCAFRNNQSISAPHLYQQTTRCPTITLGSSLYAS